MLTELILSNPTSITNWLWLVFMIFARFLGAINMCPFFSDKFLSMMLRSSLAFVLACIVVPHYSIVDLSNMYWLNKVILVASNFLCGAVIGYVVSLPIYAIESCGNIIDMQRGEQMGSIINPATKNPASSVGKLLSQAFIVYLVVNNGLLFFFNLIFSSFDTMPLNNLLPLLDATHINKYVTLIAEYFYWVVVLALPVITLMFFIDMILGVISSFIPQLNVTVLAMPIKSISALFMLSIYIGYLFHGVFIKLLIQSKNVI